MPCFLDQRDGNRFRQPTVWCQYPCLGYHCRIYCTVLTLWQNDKPCVIRQRGPNWPREYSQICVLVQSPSPINKGTFGGMCIIHKWNLPVRRAFHIMQKIVFYFAKTERKRKYIFYCMFKRKNNVWSPRSKTSAQLTPFCSIPLFFLVHNL